MRKCVQGDDIFSKGGLGGGCSSFSLFIPLVDTGTKRVLNGNKSSSDL